MKNKKIIWFLKLAVTGGLVMWLIFSINWQEVMGYLINVKIPYLILYLMVFLIGVGISSYKWDVLSRYKKFKRDCFFYFRSYLLGAFLNNFFPSFVGGDAYRTYSLGKQDNKMKDSFATVFVDRVSGFVGLMILSALFGLINYSTLWQFPYWKVFLFVDCGLLFLMFLGLVFYKSALIQKIIDFFPKIIKKHLDNVTFFAKRPEVAVKSLLLSFLFSFVGLAFLNYILFLAFGVPVGIVDYLSVIFLISIIASIPISMGNIGVKEWAYITLFGIFAIESSAAITIVIVSRFLQMLASLIAVPFYLKEQKDLVKK